MLNYAAALVAVTLAMLFAKLILWVLPILPQPPVEPFVLAVMVSAWRGGAGPGFAASLVSALACGWLVVPVGQMGAVGPADALRLGTFVLLSVLVSSLATARRKAAELSKEREKCFQLLFDTSPDPIYVTNLSGNILDLNPAARELREGGREELIGKNIVEVFPLRWRKEAANLLPLLASDGRERTGPDGPLNGEHTAPIKIWACRLLYAGSPAVLLRIHDSTRRRQTEDELKRTTLSFNTLLEVNRSLTSILDRTTLVGQLLEQLAPVIPGANIGTLYIYNPQVKRLIPEACVGLDAEALRQIRLLPGESISGKVFETGRPTLARTPEEVEAMRGKLRPENARLLVQASEGRLIQSHICVPLRTSTSEILGTLTLGSTSRTFTEQDLYLLEVIAAQAAVAIKNAHSFEQVVGGRERLEALSAHLIEVQEAERNRISRELHDEIGQSVTGLLLLLRAAARSPDKAGAKLKDAEALLTELADRVRNLSLDLRPPMLDHLGLLPALLWLFERYTKQTSVRVCFEHFGVASERFRATVETAAYRILQEALTNVARHASVDEVHVRVRADETLLILDVSDQGVGFDPLVGPHPPRSAGLVGMQERASLLGGSLVVETNPGAGTRLIVELPLDDSEEASRDGADCVGG